MGIFNKEHTPQERIRNADKKIQQLRDKRSNTDSDKKIEKINKKIHEQNVEIRIAEMELKNPANNVSNKTNNITTNFNANFNQTNNGVHLHGYFNNTKENKKK